MWPQPLVLILFACCDLRLATISVCLGITLGCLTKCDGLRSRQSHDDVVLRSSLPLLAIGVSIAWFTFANSNNGL